MYKEEWGQTSSGFLGVPGTWQSRLASLINEDQRKAASPWEGQYYSWPLPALSLLVPPKLSIYVQDLVSSSAFTDKAETQIDKGEVCKYDCVNQRSPEK